MTTLLALGDWVGKEGYEAEYTQLPAIAPRYSAVCIADDSFRMQNGEYEQTV